jgi:uncharacterized protein
MHGFPRLRTIPWVGLLALLGAPAIKAESIWTGPPVLVTRGDAVVRATPDRALLTLGTEARAGDAKQAQTVDAKNMTAVRQTLAQAGIPDTAIRTVNYDLQLEYDFTNGKQVPRGYVARHAIEVRIDDIATTGDVIAKAVGSGAAAVQGVRFELKDRKPLERAALKAAVEDARARADAAAAGAGMVAAGVVRVEEGGSATPPVYEHAMRTAMADAAVETPIAAGELEIRATVILTSALK